MSTQLIPVVASVIGNQTVQTVDGRALHTFLEVGKVFAAWIQERIEQYGFEQGKDFEVFSEIGKNLQGGRPTKEYALTLDMAKELAMVERTAKGKEARQYFIECERRLLENTPSASSNPTLAAQLAELLKGKVLVDYQTLAQFVRLTWGAATYFKQVGGLAETLEQQCGKPLISDLMAMMRNETTPASTPAPAQDAKWRVDLSDALLPHIIDAGPQGVDHRDLQQQCWAYRRAPRDERNAALNRLLAQKQIVQRPLRQNERAPRYVATSMEAAS